MTAPGYPYTQTAPGEWRHDRANSRRKITIDADGDFVWSVRRPDGATHAMGVVPQLYDALQFALYYSNELEAEAFNKSAMKGSRRHAQKVAPAPTVRVLDPLRRRA